MFETVLIDIVESRSFGVSTGAASSVDSLKITDVDFILTLFTFTGAGLPFPFPLLHATPPSALVVELACVVEITPGPVPVVVCVSLSVRLIIDGDVVSKAGGTSITCALPS